METFIARNNIAQYKHIASQIEKNEWGYKNVWVFFSWCFARSKSVANSLSVPSYPAVNISSNFFPIFLQDIVQSLSESDALQNEVLLRKPTSS